MGGPGGKKHAKLLAYSPLIESGMNYPGFGYMCRNNLPQQLRSRKGHSEGSERQKK